MVGKEFTFQSGTIQAALIIRSQSFQNHLHSNLVQFKPRHVAVRLNINLHLHSNLVQFKLASGAALPAGNNKIFTFQSGTIQAKLECGTGELDDDLHSNLVQFKLVRFTLLIFLLMLFTFQSGTIQAFQPRQLK